MNKFLLPSLRSKTIKPIHLILKNKENPYWDNTIEKYLKDLNLIFFAHRVNDSQRKIC